MKKTLLYLLFFSSQVFSEPAFKYICKFEGSNQICDVFLTQSIESPDNYKDLQIKILTLKEGDKVYLHLVGEGGKVDGMTFIYNFLTFSKAEKISVIDGSVMSAHAFLAFAFGVPEFRGYGYVLFHTVSSTNMSDVFCVKNQGLDRGLDIYEKCKENLPKITKSGNDLFLKVFYNILTKKEIDNFMAGRDIIISFDELKKRLGV